METKKTTLPEATLGQYKGLAVTRHVRPVTEQTLQQELIHQTRTHAVYHNTNAPAKAGDRVLLTLPVTWTARRSRTAGWSTSWWCWATAS